MARRKSQGFRGGQTDAAVEDISLHFPCHLQLINRGILDQVPVVFPIRLFLLSFLVRHSGIPRDCSVGGDCGSIVFTQ